VILATQVLESMTTEGRPTRAEVSDAAYAVDEGVDAIMLAAETAIGAFPARAVQTLDSIIRTAEADRSSSVRPARRETIDHDHAQAICEAAVTLAEHAEADVIVAMTLGGGTARRLSALRPRVPIMAITETVEMARRLSLLWGVFPVAGRIARQPDSLATSIGRQLIECGLVPEGALVVLASISDDLSRVDANYLRIRRL
jgi:pyruvate kinase